MYHRVTLLKVYLYIPYSIDLTSIMYGIMIKYLFKGLESTTLNIKGTERGEDETIQIPKMKREKSKKTKESDKKIVYPMRFGDSRLSQPSMSRLKMRQPDYMMDFNDDEDDNSFKLPSIAGAMKIDGTTLKVDGDGSESAPPPPKPKKKAKGASVAKGPVREFVAVRDKVGTQKKMREVTNNDLELRVFDKHSSVRRMPLTEEAEKWLNDKEKERCKQFEEKVKKLKDEFNAKADKGKKDGKDKGDKKDTKKDSKKKVEEEPPKIISKYKSASQFMSIHFPVFESLSRSETMGPMRAQQLNECAQIIEVFEQHGIQINKESVYKGILIPQDKPESICLEDLRQGLEGLMVNPLPKEYWRKEMAPSKKKGKGGKGKGKKK